MFVDILPKFFYEIWYITSISNFLILHIQHFELTVMFIFTKIPPFNFILGKDFPPAHLLALGIFILS